MPETIQWTVNVAVAGGPRKTESRAASVGVYVKGQVDIEATKKGKIEVKAGGQVRFLLITANFYGPEPKPLTYKVGGKGPFTLDGPHLMVGAGAVALYGTSDLTFEFTNEADKTATVEILVGRDAS